MQAITKSASLRAARPDDEPFLREVYASTRADELAPLPWPDTAKAAFLEMQFRAQHQHYHTYYEGAAFDVILVDGAAAGRFYVDRSQDEILLLDVALLPAFRNSGIGTHLLRGLLAEAAARGKPVRLHVETFNPARRLYERLGFTVVEERETAGVYQTMEWVPPPRVAD